MCTLYKSKLIFLSISAFNDEVGVLDNVPHPNWPELASTTPEMADEPIAIIKQSDEETELSSETDFKANISKIEDTPKRAKQLLHNLSEILNSTTRSDQQRSEGQHLINSLAELLSDRSNVKSSNLDDSGHSSFIHDISDTEKHQVDSYEMPEYNRKSTSVNESQNLSNENWLKKKAISKFSEGSSNRLSLSLNSALPARMSQQKILKRGSLSRISLDSSKNVTGSSNSSVKSDNISTGNGLAPLLQNNLKVKVSKEVSRKGPLKAVIPVKELKKSGEIMKPTLT